MYMYYVIREVILGDRTILKIKYNKKIRRQFYNKYKFQSRGSIKYYKLEQASHPIKEHCFTITNLII